MYKMLQQHSDFRFYWSVWERKQVTGTKLINNKLNLAGHELSLIFYQITIPFGIRFHVRDFVQSLLSNNLIGMCLKDFPVFYCS